MGLFSKIMTFSGPFLKFFRAELPIILLSLPVTTLVPLTPLVNSILPTAVASAPWDKFWESRLVETIYHLLLKGHGKGDGVGFRFYQGEAILGCQLCHLLLRVTFCCSLHVEKIFGFENLKQGEKLFPRGEQLLPAGHSHREERDENVYSRAGGGPGGSFTCGWQLVIDKSGSNLPG